MRTVARLCAASGVGVSALIVPLTILASPASALSCVPASDVLKDAEQVFTGRVTSVDDGFVHVKVDESWRGALPGDEIDLRVQLIEWTAWGSFFDEQTPKLDTNAEWVFAPEYVDAGDIGVLTVNACSVWPKAGKEVLAARPENPKSPTLPEQNLPDGYTPEGDQTRDTEVPAVALAGAAGGVTGAAVLGAFALRRRRKSTPAS
jgi:hypothetical protein